MAASTHSYVLFFLPFILTPHWQLLAQGPSPSWVHEIIHRSLLKATFLLFLYILKPVSMHARSPVLNVVFKPRIIASLTYNFSILPYICAGFKDGEAFR